MDTATNHVNTTSLARKFITRFNYGPISVEQFDIFIIDHYLAEDPETEDTKDARYMKFVKERSTAKSRLNKVGGDVEERFQIVKHRPGHEYMVVEYNEAIRESTAAISTQVRRFAENKTTNLNQMSRKLDQMLLASPEDVDLLNTSAMVAEMITQSAKLSTKVAGLTHQYQVAWSVVEEKFKALADNTEE